MRRSAINKIWQSYHVSYMRQSHHVASSSCPYPYPYPYHVHPWQPWPYHQRSLMVHHHYHNNHRRWLLRHWNRPCVHHGHSMRYHRDHYHLGWIQRRHPMVILSVMIMTSIRGWIHMSVSDYSRNELFSAGVTSEINKWWWCSCWRNELGERSATRCRPTYAHVTNELPRCKMDGHATIYLWRATLVHHPVMLME